MFEISVEESFAAAHALRGYRGKCENLHGHNYKVQVTLQGEALDRTGLLVDFAEVKKILHDIIERLDHRNLNEIAPFDRVNPSAENIARYFYEELSRRLAETAREVPVRVACVRIWETETATASYRP
ncbi:MAG: 6-carboxytetrahydropterin synthase QueD [Bryobacterales bacterium]|nr:6-carboxytetrahydropterin synthase QueD [Bryobacteraceae bacterium]MDW8353748.1 6-carboxytetrahydropterin synthase QueD [Bryobacterales bacterium]